jgi:V8-like Glu-specific endopeptidase
MNRPTANPPPRKPPARRRRFALAAVAVLTLLPAARPGAALEPDGRLIVEAMEYPWSAIGRVNAGGRAYCTGFLIGIRHVMTAAHCLYDAIEGRWWAASELHFVAGYQRDQYVIHSAVGHYERSARFDPAAEGTSKSAVTDRAILTLEEPIGQAAGWLGLKVLDKPSIAALMRSSAQLLQAGYRSGRSHALTANHGCRLVGLIGQARGIVHDCPVYHGDSGSPLMLLADGRLWVVGLQVVRTKKKSNGDAVAGAVSAAVFRQDVEPQASRALKSVPGVWRLGRSPGPDSPAAAQPRNTIANLLERLGYLASEDSAERSAAIRAFERAQGLPVTGAPSLALLGELLRAAP